VHNKPSGCGSSVASATCDCIKTEHVECTVIGYVVEPLTSCWNSVVVSSTSWPSVTSVLQLFLGFIWEWLA
jgi:hypothetical protein